MPEQQPYKLSRQKVFAWLSEVVSLLGVVYCVMGYSMVASFSVAAPERKLEYVFNAKRYIFGMAAFSVTSVILAIFIFKGRKTR